MKHLALAAILLVGGLLAGTFLWVDLQVRYCPARRILMRIAASFLLPLALAAASAHGQST